MVTPNESFSWWPDLWSFDWSVGNFPQFLIKLGGKKNIFAMSNMFTPQNYQINSIWSGAKWGKCLCLERCLRSFADDERRLKLSRKIRLRTCVVYRQILSRQIPTQDEIIFEINSHRTSSVAKSNVQFIFAMDIKWNQATHWLIVALRCWPHAFFRLLRIFPGATVAMEKTLANAAQVWYSIFCGVWHWYMPKCQGNESNRRA